MLGPTFGSWFTSQSLVGSWLTVNSINQSQSVIVSVLALLLDFEHLRQGWKMEIMERTGRRNAKEQGSNGSCAKARNSLCVVGQRTADRQAHVVGEVREKSGHRPSLARNASSGLRFHCFGEMPRYSGTSEAWRHPFPPPMQPLDKNYMPTNLHATTGNASQNLPLTERDTSSCTHLESIGPTPDRDRSRTHVRSNPTDIHSLRFGPWKSGMRGVYRPVPLRPKLIMARPMLLSQDCPTHSPTSHFAPASVTPP